MSGQISLQADVGNIPGNAVAGLGALQPLLKAISADNLAPLAVLQAKAIGDCFHSNGEWADKLPDLMSRASSVRLERLSAWIGWHKGDAAAQLSQTSGGRTASLLCLSLANLYSSDECGAILRELSSSILSGDQRNSSTLQLSQVCAYLAGKLSCLGFGNLLAEHLTRIRWKFFDLGIHEPLEFNMKPTEESICEFLVALHKALQEQDLTLRFSGSLGAGPLLALVMCLCPEDVRVEIQGELIERHERDSIIFSIDSETPEKSNFRLETNLGTHSEAFRRHFITHPDVVSAVSELKFRWSGYLSSCLSILLSEFGAANEGAIRQALANFIAASAICMQGKDFESNGQDARFRLGLPKNGFKTLLGHNHKVKIKQILGAILVEPDCLNELDVVRSFIAMYRLVSDTVSLTTVCTCVGCEVEYSAKGFPLHPARRDVIHSRASTLQEEFWSTKCRYFLFWNTIGGIFDRGLVSLLIRAEDNPTACPPEPPQDIHDSLIGRVMVHVLRSTNNGDHRAGPKYGHGSFTNYIHLHFLKLVVPAERSISHICESSESSTIFPRTLQYPSIDYPWRVEYILVDGRLRYETDTFSTVISEQRRPQKKRKVAQKKGLKGNHPPSSLGEHYGFSMTVKPAKSELVLRCTIQASATQSFTIDFLDNHLGFMALSPTDTCEHANCEELDDESIWMTSVDMPLSKKGTIAVTLTYYNPEAQFLCCTTSTAPAGLLYHVDCCLHCAVAQAREDGTRLIIGGRC